MLKETQQARGERVKDIKKMELIIKVLKDNMEQERRFCNKETHSATTDAKGWKNPAPKIA